MIAKKSLLEKWGNGTPDREGSRNIASLTPPLADSQPTLIADVLADTRGNLAAGRKLTVFALNFSSGFGIRSFARLGSSVNAPCFPGANL